MAFFFEEVVESFFSGGAPMKEKAEKVQFKTPKRNKWEKDRIIPQIFLKTSFPSFVWKNSSSPELFRINSCLGQGWVGGEALPIQVDSNFTAW